MVVLKVFEQDWDTAVERVSKKSPNKNYDNPDVLCENCAITVAAERQFGKTSYTLETLEVEEVGEFACKTLTYQANRFDDHMKHGRLKPVSWPLLLYLEPITKEDPRSFYFERVK